MRRLIAIVTLFAAAAAYAAPPSQESVEQLLAATRAEATIDAMFSSLEPMMRQSMQQATQGKPLSAQQQRVLDAVPPRFAAIIRQELGWQKMKPLYVQIYQETFEQQEVDGMLAFYASPAGQAFVNKMPVVMQKSMALSQQMMKSVLPRMQQAMKEALAQAKAAN
ncbi:DUF2059 domain-containing protein [Caenimonas terrae]|uniref:DUF2059 domain-containing protein n=1 Tax=Caenimonas terrae TaxID=696074 RepID=A0ABW0NHD4_9BURK